MTLRLQDLSLSLPRNGHLVPVLENISLTIPPGHCAALIGESGSGKSLTALAIPRLLPPGAHQTGQIFLGTDEISSWSEPQLRTARGRRIGMVFQDPASALNPLQRIGNQIAEPLRLHNNLSRGTAWARAIELLAEMGLERPAERARDYPHQFSGGMLQRAAIAAAIACGPELLIADEPVSSLDSASAAQIMALLDRLRATGLAILLVSHDLRLVRAHASTATVLYAGRIAEQGPAEDVLRAPLHPYTHALARAAPRLGHAPAGLEGQVPEPEQRGQSCRFAPRCAAAQPACTTSLPPLPPAPHTAACFFPSLPPPESPAAAVPPPPATAEPLLTLRDVTVSYPTGWPWQRAATLAVAPTSLTLWAGECLAIIGQSGSGKTSLIRAILQMLPYGGAVELQGTNLATVRGAARGAVRRRIGLVFQNPAASLNPTMTIAALIAEPMRLAGAKRAEAATRATSLLQDVGLSPALLPRRASTLSGGQAQRVAIARALAANPALLVLDEPTASLDTVTQALILTLLRDLATARGLSYIVITHDLASVSFMAHRIAVMQNGKITELQSAEGKESVLF